MILADSQSVVTNEYQHNLQENDVDGDGAALIFTVLDMERCCRECKLEQELS